MRSAHRVLLFAITQVFIFSRRSQRPNEKLMCSLIEFSFSWVYCLFSGQWRKIISAFCVATRFFFSLAYFSHSTVVAAALRPEPTISDRDNRYSMGFKSIWICSTIRCPCNYNADGKSSFEREDDSGGRRCFDFCFLVCLVRLRDLHSIWVGLMSFQCEKRIFVGSLETNYRSCWIVISWLLVSSSMWTALEEPFVDYLTQKHHLPSCPTKYITSIHHIFLAFNPLMINAIDSNPNDDSKLISISGKTFSHNSTPIKSSPQQPFRTYSNREALISVYCPRPECGLWSLHTLTYNQYA